MIPIEKITNGFFWSPNHIEHPNCIIGAAIEEIQNDHDAEIACEVSVETVANIGAWWVLSSTVSTSRYSNVDEDDPDSQDSKEY